MNWSASFFLIGLLLGLFSQPAAAQDLSEADTIAEWSAQSENLRQLLEQQRTDSLRRKALEDRLLSIDWDDREKQRLLEELNVLKSRDSIRLARRKQTVDSLRALNQGVPVAPFGDTLFTIYASLGSYSARERAAIVEARIRTLAAHHEFQTDSLLLEEQETTYLIRWRDQFVTSINETDGLWMNTPPRELAERYLQAIRQGIDDHRNETSLRKILIGILQAMLVVVILFLLIKVIGKLTGFVKRRAVASKDSWFKGIYIRGYELVSAHRQVKAVWFLIDVLKAVLIIALVYLAVPLVFNLFPATRGYAPVLLGYFLKPIKEIGLAIIDYFPNLITITVICVLFRYFLKLLKFFANELESGALTLPGFYPDWAMPTYQILRVMFLAFLIIVIFPYLPGSDSPIFKGVSVFIGVLFTFGSTGALSNIVAGLVLTYMRSFTVGDRVKIGEVIGDIIEKSLLVTRIRTVKNEVISIPNAQVMNSHTINYSMDAPEKGLIIHTNLSVGYDVPWQRVHELAIRAAEQVELLESDPPPFVLQSSLDDFYVTYQVNAYTKSPNKQAIIYSDLHRQLLDEFHRAGIELLSPHFRAVRSNEGPEMPPQA